MYVNINVNTLKIFTECHRSTRVSAEKMLFWLTSSGLTSDLSAVMYRCNKAKPNSGGLVRKSWNRLETFHQRGQQNTAFQPVVKLLFNKDHIQLIGWSRYSKPQDLITFTIYFHPVKKWWWCCLLYYCCWLCHWEILVLKQMAISPSQCEAWPNCGVYCILIWSPM